MYMYTCLNDSQPLDTKPKILVYLDFMSPLPPMVEWCSNISITQFSITIILMMMIQWLAITKYKHIGFVQE